MPQIMQVPHCNFSTTKLVIDDNIPYEQWEQIGSFIVSLEQASNFWLGDWLRHGEKLYGEKYSQGMELTKMQYDTLAHIKYVADNVLPENRVEGIPYSHHRLVASLPATEQRRWLEVAQEHNLSFRAFRKALTEARGINRQFLCACCRSNEEGYPRIISVVVCRACEERLKIPIQKLISDQGGSNREA